MSDPHGKLSTAEIVRQMTGGEPLSLYGIPAVIGTDPDFPLTHRPGAYMGIDRTPTKPPREGDQPTPTRNDLPEIHDLVCGDMQARKRLGTQRYGTPLQAHNGRDALRDHYEELLDACAYARQMLFERDGR